jgi:hypothetical protein
MKNLLSENMLRFGTKNLSEARKTRISSQISYGNHQRAWFAWSR